MFQLLIVVGVYALLILAGGLALWGWLQARSFLQSYESISSQREFDEFKRIVKSNMYLALAIMGIVGLMLLLGVVGLFLRALGWLDMLVVFLVLGPFAAFAGVMLTVAENRMKALPVENESLRLEFEHVIQRWTSSAFPDW